jgi:TonB family protein
MSVAARDKSQRLAIVPVPTSDNVLFVGYLIAVIGGYVYATALERGPDVVPYFLAIGVVGAGISVAVLEIIAQLKLGRLKAFPLPINEATAGFRKVLEREKEKIGLSQNALSVFWTPTNWRMGARVLGGFSRKLVVTGTACVAIAKEDPAALFVLRHELAHIKNRDTRLYLVVVYAYIVPIAMLAGPDQLVLIFLNVVMVFLVSTFLLRRREYLADAVAANSGQPGTQYLDFLSRMSSSERGWFHPSPARRVKALTSGSPALSISWGFLLLCALAVGGGLFNILKANVAARYTNRLPNELTGHNLIFLIIVVPFLAMFFEIAKDYRGKIPSDSSLNLAGWADKRWIPAFCAINGSWWAMTTFFRFFSLRFLRPTQLVDWAIGSCASLLIAVAWFVVGFGLLRYKRWARWAGLVLAVTSIAGHVYEFANKQDLAWFGWYQGRDYDERGISLMLFIMVGSGVAIVIGLLRRKSVSELPSEMHIRTNWSQNALAPSLMVILIVGMMAFTISTSRYALRDALNNHTEQLEAQQMPSESELPPLGGTAAAPINRGSETDPPGTIRIPPDVMAAMLVSKVEPTYPAEARQAGSQGVVRLKVRIARNGSVEYVSLISGHRNLATAAAEAVKGWKYKPYLLNGDPVEVTTEVTVKFSSGH